MKAYVITDEELKLLKGKLNTLKKEEMRFLKKLENGTADSYDSTQLDKVSGAVVAIEFVFKTIGIK